MQNMMNYGLYRLVEGKDADNTVWNNMNLSMILKYLNDHINEFEQGENRYHDIPVKKGKVDWELISEAVREDRLHVGNCNIQLYPVHKSAHDELLEIYKEQLQKQIDRNRKTYFDYVERCSMWKAADSIVNGGMGSFLIGEIENNLVRVYYTRLLWYDWHEGIYLYNRRN